MCLSNIRRKPYNKSNIRWKVVFKNGDGHFQAPFRLFHYNKTTYNTCLYDGVMDYSQYGFHVCVTRKDARRLATHLGAGFNIVKKVRAKDFIRSGMFQYGQLFIRSETWKQFKFIK